MTKAEMEKDVARLMDALRRAVAQINWERMRRRPKFEGYSEPLLGRSDLVAIERRHSPTWRDLLEVGTIDSCSAPVPVQVPADSESAHSPDGSETEDAAVRAT